MYRCAPDKNVAHHCALSTVAVRLYALDQTTRYLCTSTAVASAVTTAVAGDRPASRS
jgi:hypothetical protein